MQEIAVKTHLIITDIHDEYNINWCGKLADAEPLMVNEMPVFVIISRNARVELNTFDIKRLEECAKAIAEPKGRGAVSKDSSFIYIKEVDGKELLLGTVTKTRIKKFQQMYDKVGWR